MVLLQNWYMCAYPTPHTTLYSRVHSGCVYEPRTSMVELQSNSASEIASSKPKSHQSCRVTSRLQPRHKVDSETLDLNRWNAAVTAEPTYDWRGCRSLVIVHLLLYCCRHGAGSSPLSVSHRSAGVLTPFSALRSPSAIGILVVCKWSPNSNSQTILKLKTTTLKLRPNFFTFKAHWLSRGTSMNRKALRIVHRNPARLLSPSKLTIPKIRRRTDP